MVEQVDRALEPCPFCGGKATSWTRRPDGTSALVWCRNSVTCGAEVSLHEDDLDAITAWNTRHRTEATAALEERVKLLEAELRNMLEHYLGIAHSGDAGFWDPETEPEVISARAALNDPQVTS